MQASSAICCILQKPARLLRRSLQESSIEIGREIKDGSAAKEKRKMRSVQKDLKFNRFSFSFLRYSFFQNKGASFYISLSMFDSGLHVSSYVSCFGSTGTWNGKSFAKASDGKVKKFEMCNLN